ncbi:hypothetical protein HELRODRAFT_177977 [Helobdella robusta]|uniref:MULE transposase domain-containing protein n=1 Tax=Helobdella robusta TaxID=6412 RepID=T1FCK1_HELRO|nr:hypothetical protein HELRODRAFT_177977 [Helobdella robusta]ESN97545.1 hypothetical protein HELRODRAFT_177977 [Helobdella robusta]
MPSRKKVFKKKSLPEKTSSGKKITEIKCQKEHNHVSEPEEIAKAKVLNEMKKTAILSSTAKQSQIYADALSGLDEEDRANMREGNENVIIYDSGANPFNRIIVFSTFVQLQQMGRSTRWFMDGNFSLSPNIFHQLYFIRVAYLNHYVTCAYALMTSRNQASYEEVFKAIKDKAQEHNIILAPTTVMLDFEIAPRRALHDIFGANVEVVGCFFHLTQSTWRKVGIIVSLWTLISAIKKDQTSALTSIGQIDRGIQINKPKKRQSKYFQERMERLCKDVRDGRRSTLEALRAIGHCIVLNRKNLPMI